MKYKLTHPNSSEPTYCEERQVAIYLRKGWKVVNDTPKKLSDKRYDRLTKAQLQEKCEELGITYIKDNEMVKGDTRKELINKLIIVSNKSSIKPSASNKGFHDSLLKK
jgi:hypothetical protein